MVAIPLIALLTMGITGLVLQNGETQARAVATRANNLSNAANLVLVDALNAETSVRGYALTRDPAFLSPYRMIQTRLGAERAALRDAADSEQDGIEQQALDAAAGAALADLGELLGAVDQGESPEQISVLLQTGKAAMDELRRLTDDLIAAPASLVAAERVNINSLETALTTLDIAGLVVGVLAGLVGVALFTSGISRRLVDAAANADRLGEGQPLRPVADADDDLGRLARSLVRAEQLLATRTTQIEAARDEALHATQAKNAFLSNTSHELRTPLNSILGFTQLLELSELSADDRDSVTRILVAGRHLLALINELIDTARIESGELTLSIEPVAVGPLIREIAELLAPLAAERSVTIVHERGRPGLAVHSDRQRLRQVVLNLMSNAVKYNRRDGTITISCQAPDADRIEIIVSDTGPGLTADHVRRLFVPFDRLGAERTGIEGTGIGLPLAKALAEAMGGQLAVTSVPGQGSTFTVALRRAPNVIHAEPADANWAQPVPHKTSGHISVLYIEDNPTNIEVVARFLRARGDTTLLTAQSGRAGVELAIREVPDIILLDLHLPDLHGERVFEELRAEPAISAVPVVVLSADASPGVIRRLRADGVLAYLTKPIDLGQLGQLLDSVAVAAGLRIDPHDVPRQAARSPRATSERPSERPVP